MYKYLFAFSFLVLFACGNEKSNQTAKSEKEHAHHKHGHKKGNKHRHGDANEHMHQSSVEDLIQRFESPERDEYQQPEKVIQYLGDLNGKSMMDIGAGSGYFSVKLAEKGAHVIAADVDEEFQNYLKERIEKNKLENIELRKIEYDSPMLADQEVDIVFMVNVYHHIENRKDYFTKVKTGTKETGELVIVDFFKKEAPIGPPVDHKISKEQVIEELKEAGYSSFETEVDLLPYQYIIRAK